jgi:hypothetical protein
MLAIIIGIVLIALGMMVFNAWLYLHDDYLGAICIMVTLLVVICCLVALTDLGTFNTMKIVYGW